MQLCAQQVQLWASTRSATFTHIHHKNASKPRDKLEAQTIKKISILNSKWHSKVDNDAKVGH